MCVKEYSEERSEPSKSDNLVGNFRHRSNAQLLMKIHVNL